MDLTGSKRIPRFGDGPILDSCTMIDQTFTKLAEAQKMHITLVEDNVGLAEGISHFLRDQGHAVNIIHDGEDGLNFLLQEETDVVILDINLPARDGVSILKALRLANKQTPVILLTARAELKDRVNGLDAGADDYLVKPFDMEELEARLRALMRRKPSLESGSAIQIGLISFNRTTRQLIANNDNIIALTRRELAAFECLFDRQNTIVSKAQLADHIYGVGADIDENVVEIYVSRLRKKLAEHDVQIKAARGLGYMMDALK